MTNKEYLVNEAERLFIYELNTTNEIASKLNISMKSVCRWKEKYDWEVKKKTYLKSKQCFHEELYEFARKLMKDIMHDMNDGVKVDPGRMYAFCRVIPMFSKVKDYEDIIVHKEVKEEPKGLTPELVKRIEEEVLGITYNDNETEQ